MNPRVSPLKEAERQIKNSAIIMDAHRGKGDDGGEEIAISYPVLSRHWRMQEVFEFPRQTSSRQDCSAASAITKIRIRLCPLE